MQLERAVNSHAFDPLRPLNLKSQTQYLKIIT